MVLLVLVLGVPATGAVATALMRSRAQEVAGLVTAVATTAVSMAMAAEVWRSGMIRARLPGPGGVEPVLVGDGLAAAMVGMTTVVGLVTGAFAVAHHRFEPGERHRAYWPLLLVLWTALHGLFVAGDLFTIYLMLELIGVSGAALVILGAGRRTLLAGTRYFFAELAASATFLVGTALVWAEAGTVELAALPDGLASTSLGGAGLAVMTAGLLLKVPLFPLHFWLPPAHSLAPTTVSPILSAVVVKSAFVVLVRLWSWPCPGRSTRPSTCSGHSGRPRSSGGR